jgi:dolichol-phosphate mannosyltransferase
MDYDGETGNFRIVSRKVVDSFRGMRERLRFFGGLVSWMGFPTASIDVQHDERFSGQTSYTFRKLWKLASETIIAYSDKPLRLAIRFGFIISGLAFSYGGYIVYSAMVHDVSIMGWSSLIVSLYLLGGIIISILGVLGVYLGKAFDEIKRRPLYIISNSTFDDTSRKF